MARWFSRKNTTPFLQSLQDAIWTNLRLNMSYQKANGEVSSRVVSPLALVAKAGVWYLVAERDSDVRVYRVNRISDVEPLDEHFVRPGSFNLEEFWNTWAEQFMSNLPRYEVLLWIESVAYETFVRKTAFLIERCGTDAPEGYVAAQVTFETMEMACAHILGYNFKVFVVEPQDLHTAVMERARRVLNVAEYFLDQFRKD